MPICHFSFLFIIATLFSHVLAISYAPLHEYRGATFFDGWDYWGNVDNTTWGDLFLNFLLVVNVLNGTHHKETSLISVNRMLPLVS